MGRILCVDYGTRRAGLAASDPLGHTAQPLEVVERPKRGSLVEAVAEVARRLEAVKIVVGLPLRLDGTPGVAAEAARQFASVLGERTGLEVVLWDERLSTAEATRGMNQAGLRAKRQRGLVDKIAAAVILRSYLEAQDPDPNGPAPEEMIFPEPVPPPPRAVPDDPPPPSSRAAMKRRAAEKKNRHRSERVRWRRDLDDR